MDRSWLAAEALRDGTSTPGRGSLGRFDRPSCEVEDPASRAASSVSPYHTSEIAEVRGVVQSGRRGTLQALVRGNTVSRARWLLRGQISSKAHRTSKATVNNGFKLTRAAKWPQAWVSTSLCTPPSISVPHGSSFTVKHKPSIASICNRSCITPRCNNQSQALYSMPSYPGKSLHRTE